MLLTNIAASNVYFSVLDLKDASFCIPLEPGSQERFAFEWESPATGRKMQLCWMLLAQGLINSQTLFGNVLAKGLEEWRGRNSEVTLLQ